MNTEENKQIMARNIKKYMERNGISNQKLCDDLGFKYTTFMDWIKGVTYPRIGKVEAMAQYFGCEKSDLIEDKSNERPAKSEALISELPEDIQQIIQLCKDVPALASALLAVAQQIQNNQAAQE